MLKLPKFKDSLATCFQNVGLCQKHAFVGEKLYKATLLSDEDCAAGWMLDVFSRLVGEEKKAIRQELQESQGLQFLCDAIDLTADTHDKVIDIDEIEDVITLYDDSDDGDADDDMMRRIKLMDHYVKMIYSMVKLVI